MINSIKQLFEIPEEGIITMGGGASHLLVPSKTL